MCTNRIITNAVLALAAAMLTGSASAQQNQAVTVEFLTPIAAQDQQEEPRPYVVDSQAVSVDLDALAALTPGSALSLNTIVGPTLAATVQRVEFRDAGRFTVAGRIDNTTMGYFIIVVEDDVAVGIIDAPTLGVQFKLRSGPDGVQRIERIDNRLFPNDEILHDAANPPRGDGAAVDDAQTEPAFEAPPEGIETSACLPLTPVFDVLIVFTALARNAAGGWNAITAEALLSVETANVGYENSGINARIRLVARDQVAYAEGGDWGDHLDRLQDTNDGFMDVVHDWRDEFGADFVSLFVNEDGACGLGRCNSTSGTAFSVVNWSCAASNFSFHHEIGHNQGCLHNRADSGGGCDGADDYSYGWRFFGDSNDGWRTVMSYNNDDGDFTRINWFSNPNVLYDGQPTGVPLGDDNEAYNARTINNRAATVEGFRTSKFDVWVDFDYGGTERGSFSRPFDTVAEGQSQVSNGFGASEIPNLWIKAGSSPETVVLNKQMFVRSCGGTATIGG